MATNPMQRKARNSFLMGILVTLLISGIIIGFMFIQLKGFMDAERERQAQLVNVYTLAVDVKSGQIITPDMFRRQEVLRSNVPANAIGDMVVIQNYALEDTRGNNVISVYNENDNTWKYFLVLANENNRQVELTQTTAGENSVFFTYQDRGETVTVELVQTPLFAKVNLNANTVVTIDMIAKGQNSLMDDMRVQELNMIALPSQLETGDYIDIRMALPTGQDFIVVAKKEVTIPEVNGVPVPDTIWVTLSQDEILMLNNAIVEAWRIGARLYANIYTEPGLQRAAIPTYPLSQEVSDLILRDPNVLERAREALIRRYRGDTQEAAEMREFRNVINAAIQNAAEQAQQDRGLETVRQRMVESTKEQQDARKRFLDSLSGGAGF